MKRRVDLWIDHRKAVIVSLKDERDHAVESILLFAGDKK